MQKIYLLLRNNQQTGPFSREELLQQGLKIHDLIWVEGRSAGWRNPEEIAELQTQGDTAPLTQNTPVQVKPGAAASGARSKHIYISLPSGMAPAATESKKELQTVPAAQTASAVDEENQESFEDRVLRMQQRIAAYNESQAAAPENKEQVETKYARSLEEIREEYAGWLHRQKKQKRNFPFKPVLAAAAGFFAIVVISYLILHKDNENPPAAALQQPLPQVAGSQLLAADTDFENENEIATPVKIAPKKMVAPKESKTSTKVKPVQNNAVRANTAKSTQSKKPTPVKKEPVAEEPSVPLSQLIQIYGTDARTDKKGLHDFQLTVQNNSRQSLKVVAVDVLYYGTNGRQLQKKTMYFSNLSPHRSLSLTVPGHPKATAVTYQLGLVSSAQGLYYAKQ